MEVVPGADSENILSSQGPSSPYNPIYVCGLHLVSGPFMLQPYTVFASVLESTPKQ